MTDKTSKASCKDLDLIASATILTFLGLIRVLLVKAFTSSIFLCLRYLSCHYSSVASECPGWRKFSKPVTYHSLNNKNIYKIPAVMNCKGVAHKFRRNLARPRPGFDWIFVSALFLSGN